MDAELLLAVTERLGQIQERLDAIEKAAEEDAEE